ncbi:MAG: hypothetical protein U0939_07995 [Pirellulales bacterium]
MARNEQDREDLLREATALVERIEFTVAPWQEPIVAGFRRTGAASFYFGADPVYQFNEQRELRRGYFGGRLLKAEAGRLVWLDRRRTESAVELLREVMPAAEATLFLAQARTQLELLKQCLAAGELRVSGQAPAAADVLGRVQRWLAELPATLAAAPAPNVHRRG